MSDHGKPTGQPHAGDPPDEVAYGKVVAVGVASLCIFALSIGWSAIILHRRIAETEAASGHAKPVDPKALPQEVGIVDQVPFVSDHRLPKWRAERQAHLEGFGWVDRSKGIVHIPIEQAMEQVVAGGGPAGAPK